MEQNEQNEPRTPFHTRMEGAAHKHLNNVLAHLIGEARANVSTRDKAEAIGRIWNAGGTGERIDEAHRAVCATYNNGQAPRGRKRGKSKPKANTPPANNAATNEDNSAAAAAGNGANTMETTTTKQSTNGGALGAFGALLEALKAEIAADIEAKADADQVRAIVDDAITAAVKNLPANNGPRAVAVTLERRELPAIEMGVQHSRFEILLKACNARTRGGERLNVWLAGPAGTGKTTAAKKVAEALELPFHIHGAIATPFQLLGYKDAGGVYHSTAFRQGWENGGIVMLDEIDGSDPNALIGSVNAALANGVCYFPDGKLVPRHPDCVIIAGANTWGNGASADYVGRMKQDASLNDRFIFLHWPLDEALEAHLCGDDAWLQRVRKVRANIASRGIRGAMVTPRATMFGEALIAAGVEVADVEAMTLRKGATDEQWAQIKA